MIAIYESKLTELPKHELYVPPIMRWFAGRQEWDTPSVVHKPLIYQTRELKVRRYRKSSRKGKR